MYIRVMRRKNKDGSVAEYVQLAHNYRDPKVGYAKPKILYNFGRRDNLDEDALRRLVDGINRFLGPEDELAGSAAAQSGGKTRFLESRPMGAAWLLSGLWERLGDRRPAGEVREEHAHGRPEGRRRLHLRDGGQPGHLSR